MAEALSAPPGPLYRQLRPRPKGPSREQVAANQRARLRGAMIEAVAAHGYADTTVDEVVRLAGVSTKTLYERFGSKQECFLATFDAVMEEAAAHIAAAQRGERGCEHDWEARLGRAFDALADAVSRRPKAARLALVEVLSAGPAGLERAWRAQLELERAIGRCLARTPNGVGLHPVVLRGVVSGLWHVARLRILEGCPEWMSGRGGELLEWMLAYRSTAGALLDAPLAARPARWAPDDAVETAGRRGGERTRMLRAAAQLAAAAGCLELTSGQIARRAGVREEAFSELFDTVDDCFFAALELLSAQALACALREARGAPDWPSAVQRVTGALLCRVAEDPVLAHMAFIEMLTGGPATSRRACLMGRFAELLVRHAPARQQPSPLTAEAIVGAVWGIVHDRVSRGAARTLPALAGHVAYIVLAPSMGAPVAAQAIMRERDALATRCPVAGPPAPPPSTTLGVEGRSRERATGL
jgi:AcrR family transcriptional regulator